MGTPKISIIVPIFKAEKYLESCILQLLNQDYQNLEIILVDDGSPDTSGLICDTYAASDARIVVVHKQNGGASDARNAGLDKATGEYVCFADSDDIILPSYVSQLYRDLCLNQSADLVLQGFIQRWENKEQIYSSYNGVYEVNSCGLTRLSSDIFLNDYSGPYCKLFRKSVLDENQIRFSTEIIYAEDFDFLLRYIKCTHLIVTSESMNYIYLMHSGSVSSRIYPFLKELSGMRRLETSFSDICMICNSESLLESRKQSIANYFSRLILSNYKNSYSRKVRTNNLSSIDTSLVECFANICKTQTVFMRIVAYLLGSKKYHVLDMILYLRLVIFQQR